MKQPSTVTNLPVFTSKNNNLACKQTCKQENNIIILPKKSKKACKKNKLTSSLASMQGPVHLKHIHKMSHSIRTILFSVDDLLACLVQLVSLQ